MSISFKLTDDSISSPQNVDPKILQQLLPFATSKKQSSAASTTDQILDNLLWIAVGFALIVFLPTGALVLLDKWSSVRLKIEIETICGKRYVQLLSCHFVDRTTPNLIQIQDVFQ